MHNRKTKVARNNASSNHPITVNGRLLEDVREFAHPGIKIATGGDCNQDMNTRVSKAVLTPRSGI